MQRWLNVRQGCNMNKKNDFITLLVVVVAVLGILIFTSSKKPPHDSFESPMYSWQKSSGFKYGPPEDDWPEGIYYDIYGGDISGATIEELDKLPNQALIEQTKDF